MKGLGTAIYKSHTAYIGTIITMGGDKLYSGYYMVDNEKKWFTDVSNLNKDLTDVIEHQ